MKGFRGWHVFLVPGEPASGGKMNTEKAAVILFMVLVPFAAAVWCGAFYFGHDEYLAAACGLGTFALTTVCVISSVKGE